MNLFEYMKLMNYGKFKEFVPYQEKPKVTTEKQLIAYYLPQFHPIPENEKNWGPGFTEWRNVARALPLFQGHIQPRHPGDLGYYDLRLPDVLRQQAKIAKNYGLTGFAFYYYWFNSQVIMETPIENIYKNKDIDINYCVFWANENWTRSWDGLNSNVILRQEHSEEDDLNFIRHISKYFEDKRYIHYHGKPLLMIYRPSLFPEIRKTTDIWRKWCIQNGFKEPYLVMSQSFQRSGSNSYITPDSIGFDAAVEFPPHVGTAGNIEKAMRVTGLNWFDKQNSAGVISYKSAIDVWSQPNKYDFKLHKCVFPSWDNTPRRVNGGGTVYYGSQPKLYKDWLRNVIDISESHDLIFINAWNEWAEGAFLEPDLIYGYAYLDATYDAINGFLYNLF